MPPLINCKMLFTPNSLLCLHWFLNLLLPPNDKGMLIFSSQKNISVMLWGKNVPVSGTGNVTSLKYRLTFRLWYGFYINYLKSW